MVLGLGTAISLCLRILLPKGLPLFSFLFNLFQVVRDAISSGVDGYDAETRKSVRKAAHGLRLSRETAMSIASKAVSIIYYLLSPCLVLVFVNFFPTSHSKT